MRSVKFSPEAWEDYQYWQTTDKRIVRRILELIKDSQRNGYVGMGKPEPLKGNFSGWWSRRINDADRMVYRVDEGSVTIISLRYHY